LPEDPEQRDEVLREPPRHPGCDEAL
jgi:hypothetical protein